MGTVHYESVAIASAAAVSSAFELNGRRIAGVITPTAWTAGDISWEVYEPVNDAWRKVVDNSGALVKSTGIATAASELVLLPEIADRLVANRVRLVSTNTASEVDVNQAAARTLYVLLERTTN